MLKPLGAEWRRLHRRLARLTGDAAAAEDALQDAFIRVEEHRRGHAVQHETALFVRAASNLALDHRRRAARQSFADLETLAPVLRDDAPLQDEVLAARERLSIVRAAMDALPQRTRDVFLMHRLEGLKYREIAERLGISVSAVEKHVARTALHLSEALARSGQS